MAQQVPKATRVDALGKTPSDAVSSLSELSVDGKPFIKIGRNVRAEIAGVSFQEKEALREPIPTVPINISSLKTRGLKLLFEVLKEAGAEVTLKSPISNDDTETRGEIFQLYDWSTRFPRIYIQNKDSLQLSSRNLEQIQKDIRINYNDLPKVREIAARDRRTSNILALLPPSINSEINSQVSVRVPLDPQREQAIGDISKRIASYNEQAEGFKPSQKFRELLEKLGDTFASSFVSDEAISRAVKSFQKAVSTNESLLSPLDIHRAKSLLSMLAVSPKLDLGEAINKEKFPFTSKSLRIDTPVEVLGWAGMSEDSRLDFLEQCRAKGIEITIFTDPKTSFTSQLEYVFGAVGKCVYLKSPKAKEFKVSEIAALQVAASPNATPKSFPFSSLLNGEIEYRTLDKIARVKILDAIVESAQPLNIRYQFPTGEERSLIGTLSRVKAKHEKDLPSFELTLDSGEKLKIFPEQVKGLSVASEARNKILERSQLVEIESWPRMSTAEKVTLLNALKDPVDLAEARIRDDKEGVTTKAISVSFTFDGKNFYEREGYQPIRIDSIEALSIGRETFDRLYKAGKLQREEERLDRITQLQRSLNEVSRISDVSAIFDSAVLSYAAQELFHGRKVPVSEPMRESLVKIQRFAIERREKLGYLETLFLRRVLEGSEELLGIKGVVDRTKPPFPSVSQNLVAGILAVRVRGILGEASQELFESVNKAQEGKITAEDVAEALRKFQRQAKRFDANASVDERRRAVQLLIPFTKEPNPVISGALDKNAPPFRSLDSLAHIARVDVLKNTPQIRALLEMINGDADLAAEYRQVIERRDEFRKNQQPGERHRDLTGLLAAIALSDRLRPLLEKAIDDAIEQSTKALWERLRQGDNYVFEHIVGSGPIAANYISRRSNRMGGDTQSLITERSTRIGGQFAEVARAIHLLNSRVRPDDPNLPNLPGTGGAINPMPAGVIQEADISGTTYADQTKIALVARLNTILNSTMMSGIAVGQPYPSESGKSSMEVELTNLRTGEIAVLSFDRQMVYTGINTPKNSADAFKDQRSQTIVIEQRANPEADRQYLTWSEYKRKIGDATNPFPFRGVKRLVVIGAGDTSMVVAGGALGAETQLGKTVHTLDKVQEVVHIGTKNKTKEDVEQNERIRYHMLGLFMPRKDFPEYASVITPDSGKATALEYDERGNVLVVTDSGNRYGDDDTLIVDCRGFDDDVQKYLTLLNGRRLTALEAAQNPLKIVETEGTVLRLSPKTPTDPVSIQIGGSTNITPETSLIEIRYCYQDGSDLVSSERVTGEKQKIQLAQKLLNNNPVTQVVIPGAPAKTSILEIPAYSRFPVGRVVDSYEIFIQGPAANVPLTENEKKQNRVLEAVLQENKENSVAMFIHSPKAGALADHLANRDGNVREIPRSTLIEARPRIQNIILPEGGSKVTLNSSITLSSELVDRPFPETANRKDLLQQALGAALLGYRFPGSFKGKELTLSVQRQKPIEGSTTLRFKLTPLPSDQPYAELFDAILSDSEIQHALLGLTDPKLTNKQEVEVTLPLEFSKVVTQLEPGKRHGKIDIGGIEIITRKGSSEYQ